MKIEDYKLANGLHVVLNEDHTAPLVAVNLWYHVGSKNERPGRTGFAHLFEHMLFSGSQNVGNNEHFRHIQSVGGVLNGTTFFDRTNYYETLPSNYLALALWLESDRMGFYLPALTREKLDVQINVVKEERRLRVDNVPYGDFLERLLRLGYDSDFPYHWEVIGSMADIGAAQLDDVREFFETFYRPNNAVLTIVGDFDPGEAGALVERYFAEIPAGPAPPRFQGKRRPMTSEKRERLEAPVQLPRVYRMYHLPKFGDKAWFAGELLSNVLGLGKASRLERALIYEKQIAQDVAAFVLPTEATGMLVVWVTGKEDITTETLEQALDQELARLQSEGVTSEELERVRTQTESDFAHQLENFGQRADLLGTFTTFFDDPHLLNRWLGRYAELTPDDLTEVARQYLIPTERVTIEYVPAAAAELRIEN
ncbi:MAG TPA: pitrilysin family protein [Thermoanaerobaculia bacterium]|nr:pitrilysin family protein [Thermoanaerobaculia bacterium]